MVIDAASGAMRIWDPSGSGERYDSYVYYRAPDGSAAEGILHDLLALDMYRPVWSELGLRYTGTKQSNRTALQPTVEGMMSAYEEHFQWGMCQTLCFFVCCVSQRLNTDRMDDVTDALVDWAASFHTPEQRARMRLALLVWIRRCYYAKDYDRLMTWIGVVAPPVYGVTGVTGRCCNVWDDAARRFCPGAPWGVYTLCEAHARAILPEFRRKGRDRDAYPVPPVDEWVDVDRSDVDRSDATALHLVPGDDPRAVHEAKRRRRFIFGVPPRSVSISVSRTSQNFPSTRDPVHTNGNTATAAWAGGVPLRVSISVYRTPCISPLLIVSGTH
jgi:hypothetical protein